ncbi:MAG: transcription termination/antitermination protein NusA, partial [Muribaculaceae bacterium]|nr:transcription termination/antitermination protein NusA [Muribaculaceae bacterium]
IKLATQLTGYEIDVYRDAEEEVTEEDIYIDEFNDEIESWIIDSLKQIGLTTAKAVLKTPREVLIDQADLEEEDVDHVLNVFKAEFED